MSGSSGILTGDSPAAKRQRSSELSIMALASELANQREENIKLQSSLSAARAEVEALRLLLSRLDDAYCEQGPEMSTSERFEHRKLLIEVRTALQEQPK